MKCFSILLTCVIITLASALAPGQSPPSQQSGANQAPQSDRGNVRRQNRERKNRGERVRRGLAQMDADKDQRISRDEWKRRPKAFDRLDANHDGFITREEILARRAHRRQRDPQNPNEVKPPTKGRASQARFYPLQGIKI